MKRTGNGIDRHVIPVAAVAAGGAAGGVGAAGGASTAAAAPEAAAGASRGLGGHADALKGGASDVVGAIKDPAGSAIRAGAGAVNSGIGALRSIPEAADRFYEDLAELDRFAIHPELASAYKKTWQAAGPAKTGVDLNLNKYPMAMGRAGAAVRTQNPFATNSAVMTGLDPEEQRQFGAEQIVAHKGRQNAPARAAARAAEIDTGGVVDRRRAMKDMRADAKTMKHSIFDEIEAIERIEIA